MLIRVGRLGVARPGFGGDRPGGRQAVRRAGSPEGRGVTPDRAHSVSPVRVRPEDTGTGSMRPVVARIGGPKRGASFRESLIGGVDGRPILRWVHGRTARRGRRGRWRIGRLGRRVRQGTLTVVPVGERNGLRLDGWFEGRPYG